MNLRIVAQLNKLLSLDPVLVDKLVNTRYRVSEAYKKAEEFVYMQETDNDIPNAGSIGVLNGLVLNTAKFRIAANYNDKSDAIISFSLLELQNGKFVEVR
jgi:hypothetical protein